VLRRNLRGEAVRVRLRLSDLWVWRLRNADLWAGRNLRHADEWIGNLRKASLWVGRVRETGLRV